MIRLTLYDDKKIDTNSKDFKEKVSNAVKNYIIDRWDECVNIENQDSDYDFRAMIDISL